MKTSLTRMTQLLMELQNFRLKVNSVYGSDSGIGFPGDFERIRDNLAETALILSSIIIEAAE